MADAQARRLKEAHPDISIEFETDHREVDPERRDFDVWIAFTDQVDPTLHGETLFEETLIPVCSPALLKARGRPQEQGTCTVGRCCTTCNWTTLLVALFSHHGAGRPTCRRRQASGSTA